MVTGTEHTFPAISPFVELIKQQKNGSSSIILRDHSNGINVTAKQLLTSVSMLRNKLLKEFLQYDVLEKGGFRNRFIFIVAPPGFEYITSMLAVLSLGAAISPQSIVVRPEDINRHMRLAKPIALLYSSSLTTRIEAIKLYIRENGQGTNHNIPFVQIESSKPELLDSDTYNTKPNEDGSEVSPYAGSLFFTSGTSGNPKGVVHTYQALLASANERLRTWELTEEDVVLNQKPGNWMGGVFGIIPSLMAGACLETCAGVFNPQFFWERIKQGRVSVFDIAPTGYDRLYEYFNEHIAVLPHEQKEMYFRGIIEVRVCGVSGSLLQPHTQETWTSLRRGKPLLNLYGSTEMTLICGMRWKTPSYADMCSVGEAVPGVEVKLVDGEMRLKAPTMFTRYISDEPNLTDKAFDSEGFFKTGDCAELKGNSYKLHGRENIDVFHFWGITLRTGEIESAMFSLPYIANAIVLPLQDGQVGKRAAALVKLKSLSQGERPNLRTLRRDLTEKTSLMEFKQPTVIYWLEDGEEVPLTANGKISKLDACKRFFGEDWKVKKQVETLDLEKMQYWRMGGQC